MQARGQVEPVGLAGDSDAMAQKDQEQELRFIRAKSKESSGGADQQSSQAVSLSALDLEPNLKQPQKVDGEAQGTGAEVRMRHMERSSVPTVLSNWDKESTFEDNGMSLSRQCRPTRSFWCALHRPMC